MVQQVEVEERQNLCLFVKDKDLVFLHALYLSELTQGIAHFVLFKKYYHCTSLSLT